MTAQRPLDVRTLNSTVNAAMASAVNAAVASPRVNAALSVALTAAVARLSGRS
ncbi:hypothetical protein PV721_30545 [Streptomyces sp. MB09-01]|uniref:hypothetical protein n=1 Tax=Streptomyces sp. MB09-01 TaxID=3028666 RepID=UPI0029B90B7E|nr:hypothetical protein [Streptomyces sp. MB09-01]MDX3538606.1 hypothetical protein [Streptomyces sp. MB09-01]